MAELVASVRALRQVFRGIAVLDGVDLDVHAGEVLGLIGPNGGGKSTLLTLLAGLVRPTEGEVLVGGIPAHRMARAAQGSVGLLIAEPGLYPLLTGWENLRFFGALYGLDPDETARRVGALLDRLGLSAHMDARVGAWSSGMKQKASLARALLMEPSLLLLDEPTANLDPISARTIVETVRERADAGAAVVWVTHDLPAAEQVCDRVAFVRQGVHHVEVLDGRRAAPSIGPLFTLWKQHLETAP